MRKKAIALGFILIFSIFLLGACSQGKSELAGNAVKIFKGPGCGCCDIFVDYMGKKGFDVEASSPSDIAAIKQEHGVPDSMESCHTTIIGDYFVEGHVPVEAVEKLMLEKPDIKGIAMPGMPSGSPGMPGPKYGPFIVYAVNKDGSTSEFMRI
ncbi:DUF411 domain-containing protein [Candidatus Woesearchaeota archaeon]|nr:DUF411 domain-containing protein [Candidatus Woesearchaeota archaeon]